MGPPAHLEWKDVMPYTPGLLADLQKTLALTECCVADMVRLHLGEWHASVLLDNAAYLSSSASPAFNERNLVGDTPLDIAYLLNRIVFIETLEALGAIGDKQLRDRKGLGARAQHDRLIHRPARQGKLKTLEARFQAGGSLNERDASGNTPLHWLAFNGHFKAVKYFTAKYREFELDMNAKNNEGNTARNLSVLNGHHDIAEQLLIREVDNYISAARIWHEMSAEWTWMPPRQND